MPAADGREMRLRRITAATPGQRAPLQQLGLSLPECFKPGIECNGDFAIA